jgi:hypothetical protein
MAKELFILVINGLTEEVYAINVRLFINNILFHIISLVNVLLILPGRKKNIVGTPAKLKEE